MERNKALISANQVVEILQPHSEIINIAGSIRREKTEVKDIEIICAPKMIKQQTLFGEGKCYTCDEFKSAIRSLTGEIVHGKTGGRNLRMELESNITLDLFMPQKDDYYRQYAIRTGSGKYSQYVLANSWNKKGWVETQTDYV